MEQDEIDRKSRAALARVDELTESRAALARICGLTRAATARWEKRIPAEHCAKIESYFGGAITCEELRPDVFGERA